MLASRELLQSQVEAYKRELTAKSKGALTDERSIEDALTTTASSLLDLHVPPNAFFIEIGTCIPHSTLLSLSPPHSVPTPHPTSSSISYLHHLPMNFLPATHTSCRSHRQLRGENF